MGKIINLPEQPRLGSVVNAEQMCYVQLLEITTMYLLRASGRKIVISLEEAKEMHESGGGLGIETDGKYICVQLIEDKDIESFKERQLTARARKKKS